MFKLNTNSEVKTKPKLSVLAQFDDLCRFSNHIISSNEELGTIRDLTDKQEENRLIWLSNKEELKKLKDENKELKSTLNEMQINLSETNEKNANLKSLSRQLTHKLNSIKEFVENKIKVCRCDTNKDRLLSYFDQKEMTKEFDIERDIFSSMDDDSLFQDTFEMFPESARAIDSIKSLDLQLLFKDMDLID